LHASLEETVVSRAFSGAEVLDHNTSCSGFMFWLRLPLRRPPLPHSCAARADGTDVGGSLGDRRRAADAVTASYLFESSACRLAARSCPLYRYRACRPNASSLAVAPRWLVCSPGSVCRQCVFYFQSARAALGSARGVSAVCVNPDRLEPVSLDDNTPLSSSAGRPLCEAPANWCVASTPVVCSSACSAWGPRLGLGLG